MRLEIYFSPTLQNSSRIPDGQQELAFRLSRFQERMGLCSLSQRQHAADVQFQPTRSYSRDDVIRAPHQLLVGAQIIL